MTKKILFKALDDVLKGMGFFLMFLPVTIFILGPPLFLSWMGCNVLASSIKYHKNECGIVYVLDKVLYSDLFCPDEDE